MQKVFMLILILLTMGVNATVSYSAPFWAKTYGGSDADNAWAIQKTIDGGYIIGGYTWSFGIGGCDFWVLKLLNNGEVDWQKTYGGSDFDYVWYIHQTMDGGYIVAGSTYSFGAGTLDSWVLKLDSSGNIAWQKTYWGSGPDYANCIQQTMDGGYIVAGYTSSYGAGGLDSLVLKLDSSGGITWQKTYGGGSNDRAHSIQQTKDGGYIMAGTTKSFGAGGYDILVFKLGNDGDVAWQKTYGGSGNDEAYSIQQTKDGGYIVAGCTSSYGAGCLDFWMLKLDSSGGITWQKTYGGSEDDEAYSIQQTKDGGYVVAGATYSFGAGGSDIWVLKLDCVGEIHDCAVMDTSSVFLSHTSVSGQNTSAITVAASATITDTSITPENTSADITGVCEGTKTDSDGDEIIDICDNCPEIPNGPILGTCASIVSGVVIGNEIICMDVGDCEDGEICQIGQEDFNENTIGDVCECYADLDGDTEVGLFDLIILKNQYGRADCTINPCVADIDGDGEVGLFDLIIGKTQYGRSNCPPSP